MAVLKYWDGAGWQAVSSGGGLTLPLGQHLTFSPDSTYDIGAAAASRPRDLYLGRNATVSGQLSIGTAGANAPYIKTSTAGGSSLSVEAPNGDLYVSSKSGSNLAGNAYFNGTNWMRYDTAQPAMLVNAAPTLLVVYTAPAAANPISFTAPLQLSTAGNMTLAGTLTTPAAIYGRDIYASRADATGVIWFGNSGQEYIYFDGANYRFGTQNRRVFLNSNSAQYTPIQYATTNLGFSTGSGAWQELPIPAGSVTMSCEGSRATRIEWSVNYTNSVTGAIMGFGVYYDGGLLYNQVAQHNPGANYYGQACGVFYATPAAGSHRFGIGMNFNAGTTTVGAVTLFVTEQRA